MTRMVKADIDKYRELIIAIMKRIKAMIRLIFIQSNNLFLTN